MKNAKEKERSVFKVVECVPYQKCPLCNGTGRVCADGYTSAVFQICPTCEGERIIPMCVIVNEGVSVPQYDDFSNKPL